MVLMVGMSSNLIINVGNKVSLIKESRQKKWLGNWTGLQYVLT